MKIVVAHLDDEILWFSSYLEEAELIIICTKSENRLEVVKNLPYKDKLIILDNEDIYSKHLDVDLLMEQLSKYIKQDEEVLTHTLFGDVLEHWHHQEVAKAVNNLTNNAYCLSFSRFLESQKPRILDKQSMLKKYELLKLYEDEMISSNIFRHYPIIRDESLIKLTEPYLSF